MKNNLFFLAILFYGGFIQSGRMIDQIKSQTGGTSVWRAGQGRQEKTRYLYIGAETCASKCHNCDTMGYQYNTWKASSHAQAYEALKTGRSWEYAEKAGITENPWDSQACQKCHITAAGAEVASLAATYKKEDGVTCEACHKREFNPKTYLPEEADCLKCHNDSVHKIPLFDFNRDCLKISHPRPKSGQKSKQPGQE